MYPTVRGFLFSANGIMANIEKMNDELWDKILLVIERQIKPINSPSHPSSSLSVKPLPSSSSSSFKPSASPSSSSIPAGGGMSRFK